jgi:hypothetical protein
LPGDSERFDLCGGRVSGFHSDRSTFYIPPVTMGGEGGFAFRAGLYDSGVLNPPQSPFVKGGDEECSRLERLTVLSALSPLTTAVGLAQ